jgi:D-threo-aldose 1-dehydrogenase
MIPHPVFGLGRLHHVFSKRQRMRVLGAAYDAGFSTFDVAPSYGEGLVESQVGQFVKETGRDVVIFTKFGIPFRPIGELPSPLFFSIRAIGGAAGCSLGANYSARDFSIGSLRRSVTESLRRLRVDVIDCMFIHEPLAEVPNEDFTTVWDGLERVRREGLIRGYGITLGGNHSHAHLWMDRAPEKAAVMLPVSDSLVTDEAGVMSRRHQVLAFDYVTYLRRHLGRTPGVGDVVEFACARLPGVRPVIATRSVSRIAEYARAFSCSAQSDS